MPDPNDPHSGYRPDMDQYQSQKDVHEDVDNAFFMLGNVAIVFIVVVVTLLLIVVWRLLT